MKVNIGAFFKKMKFQKRYRGVITLDKNLKTLTDYPQSHVDVKA